MSLFGNLYTGVSGLTTSQSALNTTGHNLANVGTTGYVRQQVMQVDSNYITWGETKQSTLQYGLGVDVSAIRQVRDRFLDNSYRKELGRQGFYDVQYQTINEIESLFGEMEGVSFQNSLEGLWSSIQELAKEPDSIVARASVIQTAVSFVEHASNVGQQLTEYQKSLNTQIKSNVNNINSLAKQIDTLNKKISYVESGGLERANDLRDSRNNLLDQLGKIINITYKEQTNGVVTVMAEQIPLITEDLVNEIGTVETAPGSGMLKPVWSFLGGEDVYNFDRTPSTENDTDIGSLKGLLLTRGDKQANYTDIPIREEGESDLSYDNRVEEYNNSVGASIIMTVQAQFDQLIHGVITTINDLLAPNKETTFTAYDYDAATNQYTPKTVTINALNTEKAPVGMDENSTQGETLFNRKSMDRYSEERYIVGFDYDNTDPANPIEIPIYKTFKVYNEEDESDMYSLYTIGEIEVNSNIMNNYSLIPLNSSNGNDGFDMDTASKLASVWNEKFATISPNSLTMSTFKEYYNAFIGELATRGEQLNNMEENQQLMVTNIDNQRQQVMGVSSDEELTNLIKYQHAYNASSRYITVVDDMLEHLINRLG